VIAALYAADGRFQRSVVVNLTIKEKATGEAPKRMGFYRFALEHGGNRSPDSWTRYRLTGRVGENAIYREEP